MKEADLITLRRQLHQIPELALQEKETHALLLKTIQGLPQTYLTIRTLPDLPTALLVKVQGRDPQRTIGYRTDIDALPVTEKPDCHLPLSIPASRTLADMIST